MPGKKITKDQIAKFIQEQELLNLKDRIQIIKIVSKYFGDKVDGNDVNTVLRETFGR